MVLRMRMVYCSESPTSTTVLLPVFCTRITPDCTSITCDVTDPILLVAVGSGVVLVTAAMLVIDPVSV